MQDPLRVLVLWSISGVLLMVMLAVWRRHRGAAFGYLLLLTLDLIASAAALAQVKPVGLFYALSWTLFGALVLLPMLLGLLTQRAFSARRLRLARGLVELRQLLQPGLGLERELKMLAALQLVEQGRLEQAAADELAALGRAELRRDQLDHLHRLLVLCLLDQKPRRAIDLVEAHGGQQLALESPMICASLVRAYAETGELEQAAQLQRMLEDGPAARDPAAANLLNGARIAFLAHLGCLEQLSRLLATRQVLPDVPPSRRSLWLGVAAAARGDMAGAEAYWREALTTGRDRQVSLTVAGLRQRGVAQVPEERRAALADLVERIEERVQRYRYMPRSQGAYWRLAPVSSALLFVMAAAYLALVWAAGRYGEEGAHWFLLRFGANYPPLSLSGQPWRLVSSIFLHGHLPYHLHFVSNALALYVLGRFGEQLFGSDRVWLIFILSGTSGALASAAFGTAPSVGASGAIFGLLGALAVGLFALRGHAPEAWRRQSFSNLLLIVGLQLFVGSSVAVIDNTAHVGGLLGGCVFGWLLRPTTAGRASDWSRRAVLGGALVTLLLTLACLVLAVVRDLPLRRFERAGVALDAPQHWLPAPDESGELVLQDPFLSPQPTLRVLLKQPLEPGSDERFEQAARRQQHAIVEQMSRLKDVRKVRLHAAALDRLSDDVLRSTTRVWLDGGVIDQLSYFARSNGTMLTLLGRLPQQLSDICRPLLDRAAESATVSDKLSRPQRSSSTVSP